MQEDEIRLAVAAHLLPGGKDLGENFGTEDPGALDIVRLGLDLLVGDGPLDGGSDQVRDNTEFVGKLHGHLTRGLFDGNHAPEIVPVVEGHGI